MKFNEKLIQLRKSKNLTQEQLASALFVTRTAISKWELGNGYPSIDSLKVISEFFNVSIDELLSSNELVNLAKTNNQHNVRSLKNIVFGLIDFSFLLLLLLPFFGQKTEEQILSVPLILYTDSEPFIIIVYYILIITSIFLGITELVTQNIENKKLNKTIDYISFALTTVAALFFVASGQPYASALAIVFLVFKGVVKFRQMKQHQK